MPDIDPSSLHSSELFQSLNPSSLTLSKPNASANTAAAAQKAAKAEKDKGQQRIEYETIYTSLKANIGEKWTEYKDTIGLFVLGQLNQSELCLRIDHLICCSPETEHLHNCLITTLFANCHRDAPEPGVATFVAANDKPASGSGSGGAGKGGDKVEERLKREVMALPGRDRRRLKEVGERELYDPNSAFPISAMNDYRIARSIKLPDSVPASAGGLNKTNWDLEIRKRYTHPLSHETLEFPDSASIQHRMLPICYEEALPNGAADQCAEFVATATEMYIKDIVSSILSLTRSNFLPQQQSSKRNRARKPSLVGGGGALSSVGGRPISIGDMRFALGVSGCTMGYMPDIVEDIMGGWPEGVLEGWGDYEQELELGVAGAGAANAHAVPSTDSLLLSSKGKLPEVNGVVGGMSGVNGVVKHLPPSVPAESSVAAAGVGGAAAKVKAKLGLTNGVTMSNGIGGIDEPSADGWAGSSSGERTQLFGVLDDCLTFEQ